MHIILVVFYGLSDRGDCRGEWWFKCNLIQKSANSVGRCCGKSFPMLHLFCQKSNRVLDFKISTCFELQFRVVSYWETQLLVQFNSSAGNQNRIKLYQLLKVEGNEAVKSIHLTSLSHRPIRSTQAEGRDMRYNLNDEDKDFGGVQEVTVADVIIITIIAIITIMA